MFLTRSAIIDDCNEEEAYTVIDGQAYGHLKLRLVSPGPGVRITGSIAGLNPGKHAFHVHEYGDVSNYCENAGPHFNPFNQTHGDIRNGPRHAGDLGNMIATMDGVAVISLTESMLSFSGPTNIINRSIVVHERVDDLGHGHNEESLHNGNEGARIGCGIIYRSKGRTHMCIS